MHTIKRIRRHFPNIHRIIVPVLLLVSISALLIGVGLLVLR